MTNPEHRDARTSGADETLSQPIDPRSEHSGEDCRYFGRYRAERELGRGGMGVVLLAHDDELNIPVALKLLPDTVSDDAEGISRFKSEVLRGMTLSHPSIVRVHTFERDEQHAGIVMEYVPGETLADAKARQEGNCFDCHEILSWIEQLCVALDYAHSEAHVAHRDLKPRNIMLTPEGRVKITDFGLASMLSESLTRVATSANAVGTPPYMSPQQVLGKPATRVDDLYALGATIYDLLTGRPPFFRGDVFAQVLHEEPPSMAQRRLELGVTGKTDIPRTWERAVAACLSKEPDARPASGAALMAMLREVEMAPVGLIRVKRSGPVPIVKSPPVEASVPLRSDTESRARAAAPTKSTPEKSDIHFMPPRLRLIQTQRNGVMKFLSTFALVVALAAITAAGMHATRRTRVPQPKVVESPPAKKMEGTGRLGKPVLETSSLGDNSMRANNGR
jgi:serine/threonine protein kinase